VADDFHQTSNLEHQTFSGCTAKSLLIRKSFGYALADKLPTKAIISP
jgi:hypothetical protein